MDQIPSTFKHSLDGVSNIVILTSNANHRVLPPPRSEQEACRQSDSDSELYLADKFKL